MKSRVGEMKGTRARSFQRTWARVASGCAAGHTSQWRSRSSTLRWMSALDGTSTPMASSTSPASTCATSWSVGVSCSSMATPGCCRWKAAMARAPSVEAISCGTASRSRPRLLSRSPATEAAA